MIQYINSENKYIVNINGLYLEQIKKDSCKMNTDKSKAKRFENPDEAEFFYDMFSERHKHKPIEASPKFYYSIVFGLILGVLFILWQLSKGIN